MCVMDASRSLCMCVCMACAAEEREKENKKSASERKKMTLSVSLHGWRHNREKYDVAIDAISITTRNVWYMCVHMYVCMGVRAIEIHHTTRKIAAPLSETNMMMRVCMTVANISLSEYCIVRTACAIVVLCICTRTSMRRCVCILRPKQNRTGREIIKGRERRRVVVRVARHFLNS